MVDRCWTMLAKLRLPSQRHRGGKMPAPLGQPLRESLFSPPPPPSLTDRPWRTHLIIGWRLVSTTTESPALTLLVLPSASVWPEPAQFKSHQPMPVYSGHQVGCTNQADTTHVTIARVVTVSRFWVTFGNLQRWQPSVPVQCRTVRLAQQRAHAGLLSRLLGLPRGRPRLRGLTRVKAT